MEQEQKQPQEQPQEKASEEQSQEKVQPQSKPPLQEMMRRIEINVTLDDNLRSAGDLVVRHRCAAIVASAEQMAHLVADRSVRGGAYRIICVVDFPDGKNKGMDKFRGLHPDFRAADGFDVMLTSGTNRADSSNEIRLFKQFLNQINPAYEVRLTIDPTQNTEDLENKFSAMNQFRPHKVRISSTVKGISNKRINVIIELLRKHSPADVKVPCMHAGQVQDLYHRNTWYDVSLEHVANIFRELSEAPVEA